MSYTLQTPNGKTIGIYIDFNRNQAYSDANDYLLAANHKRERIENKLESNNLHDYEVEELERKLESLDTKCFLVNPHGEKLLTYHITGYTRKIMASEYDCEWD